MTVRVHEVWNHAEKGEVITAFNLDDMDQFERYVNAVAAVPAGFPQRRIVHHIEHDNIYTHHYREIRAAQGNDLLGTLTASEIGAHTLCVACDRYFDPTAGNGTLRSEVHYGIRR